ncbi:MAG: carbohydrate kinase [Candidatus Lokiarchaeota archaeon]|nr:carbohydrate kinase [Candidatus Lokiarchaeota archaeon]MBD3201704.1 carbohydrate kinase [Candidatus Lokiarchaeota archaeon]
MGDLFLGLDCSTQSLTALIIDSEKKNLIHRESINYENDLSKYATSSGIIMGKSEQEIHSYPIMWIEALDTLFKRLEGKQILLSKIKAICGSGQQHGTVYLNNKFETELETLDPSQSLTNQLTRIFTRETSPIWMDSSTTKQCQEIRQVLGGKTNSIKKLGSNIIERFSGPQIRKFYQEQPSAYDKTEMIHLVSSFMASLLIGKNAPIDYGDGAGMNLMNIDKKEWDEDALKATAPNLKKKLPPLVDSFEIIGNISKYFSKRYGFSANTKIIAWSGDNPNSLIGLGLIKKGQVAISLGSSDTFFAFMEELSLDLRGEGHVFGAPTGNYMSLLCFKNASLSREKLKNSFDLDWVEFSQILDQTPPGNNGKLMLPYFFPEIVPLVLKPKVFRFGFSKDDLKENIRAIIEAQFLSMRLHSQWIGEKPDIIYATGGASANKSILQILADIFKIPVMKFNVTNSAALGAALRAYKSYSDNVNKEEEEWGIIIKDFLKPQKYLEIKPRTQYGELYDDMVKIYERYEEAVLKGERAPEKLRLEFIKKYF